MLWTKISCKHGSSSVTAWAEVALNHNKRAVRMCALPCSARWCRVFLCQFMLVCLYVRAAVTILQSPCIGSHNA
eukprot:6424770-Amphidinium_carterae.1